MNKLVRLIIGRLREERGYTLIELLTVLLILGVVMGGLTGVFASATSAEADMNNRFQAQQEARLGLDKLRREAHCASAATPVGSNTSSITFTLPSYCKTYSGNASVTWCTRSVAPIAMRSIASTGSTCTGGVKWADYLTPTSTAAVCSGALCVFNYTAQTTSSLGKLHIDFPINRAVANGRHLRADDDLVLRNTTRS